MKKKIQFAMVAAFVAAVAVVSIQANQRETTMSEIMLANIEALADDSETNWGCGGNSTFIPNQTLKSTLCPPLWLGGTHLKCKAEDKICCDPSKQSDCDNSGILDII